MKFKKKLIEPRFIAIFIIIVITFILAFLSFIINDDRELSSIEKIIKDTVIMIQKGIYFPFRYLEKKYHENIVFKKNYQQCLVSKDKIKKYDLILTENEELKREIKKIRTLLSLNESYLEYDLIHATVINRDVSGWFNTLTIDKGRKNGVENEMPVIINEGLIGKIIKTSYYTSEVKLLTTSIMTSKVSVAIVIDEDELIYGLIAGYEIKTKHLIIEGIIDSTTIKKGDKVITSGFSNTFPKGILIGYVDDIKTDRYGIASIIYVTPTVDFNDIRYVSILKRKVLTNEH